MKVTAIALVVIFFMCFISCSKKDKVLVVSGTINGIQAITLYGTHNKNADYVLLSSNAAYQEMSYNGLLLTYNYTSASTSEIFIINSTGAAVAKATLNRYSTITVLIIEASYAFDFGSTEYVSH